MGDTKKVILSLHLWKLQGKVVDRVEGTENWDTGNQETENRRISTQ